MTTNRKSQNNRRLDSTGYDKTTYTKIKDAFETYGKEFAQKSSTLVTFLNRLFEGTNLLNNITYKLNYRVITDDNKKILDLVPVIDVNLAVESFESLKQLQEQSQKITFQLTEKEIDDFVDKLNNIKTNFQIASEYLKGLRSK